MDDDRIDFSALDPTLDKDRFDGLVGSILQRASDELAERRAASSPLNQIVQWKRPMLAAAAVIAMVSAGVLLRVEGANGADYAEESTGIAEAIGVPSLLAQGIRNNDMPTTAELFEAFQEIQ
jgi:hypothetical protein